MRTLVDIGENQIEALDAIAKATNQSRAALIRKAIEDYLGRNAPHGGDEAFGLWGQNAVDGLDYQEKVRSEW